MRSRNIKPGFWANEYLAECSHQARLLFIGLWCLADREGRLEYRPRKIKGELFRFEDADIPALTFELVGYGFVTAYGDGSERYIQVNNWHRHQHPHHKEVKSSIPKVTAKHGLCKTQAWLKHDNLGTCQHLPNPSDSGYLIPDTGSLIPDPTYCSELAESPASELVASVACTSGKTFSLTESQVEKWGDAYPAVDVRLTCLQAIAWLDANPKRRKTVGGMPRFLTNWLAKEQNRGGTKPTSNRPVKPQPPVSAPASENLLSGLRKVAGLPRVQAAHLLAAFEDHAVQMLEKQPSAELADALRAARAAAEEE